MALHELGNRAAARAGLGVPAVSVSVEPQVDVTDRRLAATRVHISSPEVSEGEVEAVVAATRADSSASEVSEGDIDAWVAATRVYISPPEVSEGDIEAVVAALRSGWVAPVGPHLAQFEAEMATFAGAKHAVALSSGTAAIHLGLLALGVGPGADVVVPTLTFGATAFAVNHLGARPVFLDSEATTWNLDPQLLADFLARRAVAGNLPAAIITVDLFGRMCDYEAIRAIADAYEIPVLEDAAEAVGSTHRGRQAGTLGALGVFSFNGNKIMTTSGGGMLLTDDERIASKVRHWSTQSREELPWYEHREIGFNYRMSNILAALGRSQLSRIDAIVDRRRLINAAYVDALSGVSAVEVLGDHPWGRSNMWLTTVRFRGPRGAEITTAVQKALAEQHIESRPVWKPMHMQPVYRGAESHLTGVAAAVFADGLCLPSGSTVTLAHVRLIAEKIAALVG